MRRVCMVSTLCCFWPMNLNAAAADESDTAVAKLFEPDHLDSSCQTQLLKINPAGDVFNPSLLNHPFIPTKLDIVIVFSNQNLKLSCVLSHQKPHRVQSIPKGDRAMLCYLSHQIAKDNLME